MDEIKIKEGSAGNDEKKEKMRTVEMVVLGLVIGFVLTVSGFFIWNRNLERDREINNLKNQVNNLAQKNNAKDSTVTNIEGNSSAGDINLEFKDWKTYKNTEIGYTLKYPADWVLAETNAKSEVTGMMTKYITIDSPDKKYFLFFGLKAKNDTFSISDRTGVGAGDEKSLGSITILNTPTELKGLYYKGKLQEIFFGAIGQKTTSDGKYIFSATFSSHDGTNSNGIDPNLAYIETAKKILGTVKIINVLEEMAAETEQPEVSGIEVLEPQKDSEIKSPLTVKGKAKGNWFFEAEFPVKLMDGNGKAIAQNIAKAEGEWMTEDFVPFTATVKFNAPQTDNGFLVLSKDNPSGMPENDYSISIPIKFK